jgi:Carbohydrate-selective porin, OprB family
MNRLILSKTAGITLGLMVIAAAQPAKAAEAPISGQGTVVGQGQPQVANNNLMPTDPQVQTLNRINDRYQCGITSIQQEISRADLVNSMGACLNSLEVKMAQNPSSISAEDIEQLKLLAKGFRDEIGELDGRMNTLENRISLAQNASTFSTTSKLAGEVIVGLSTYSGAAPNASGTVLSNRVRLNVDTTFTGKDRLRTRLQSRNGTPLSGSGSTATPVNSTGTNMTRLGYDGDEGNTTNLSLLQYSLPVFERSKLIVETVGSEYNENMYTFNPLLASAGTGSISRFGRYNPVYRQSGDGAAATLDHRFNDQLTGSIGYAVPTGSNDPTTGVFGGGNSAIAQLRYQPSPDINLGLTYARSYHPGGGGVTGSTGSSRANRPFGAGNPVSASHYNFLASAKVSPGLVLSGWAGLTNANREGAAGNADIFNFAVSAAFPDFGAKGNVLGLIVGVPPKVTGGSIASDPDTSLHLEALYKIKMSDNLDITPGVLLITNPEHNSSRPSEFIGTVRTTFKF